MAGQRIVPFRSRTVQRGQARVGGVLLDELRLDCGGRGVGAVGNQKPGYRLMTFSHRKVQRYLADVGRI